MEKEEIVGGVVSGAEEELDEDEEFSLFQKMNCLNWQNWRTTTNPPSSAGKLAEDELQTTPVLLPPPKPG